MPAYSTYNRRRRRRTLAVAGGTTLAAGALALTLSACGQTGATKGGAAAAAAQPAAVPVAAGTTRTAAAAAAPTPGTLLTGRDALTGDWTTDVPGLRRKISAGDLPAPYHTRSVDNGPRRVARPDGAWPKVPAGFVIEEFATNLENPRVIVTAPNGDVFVAESGPARVKVLRDTNGDGKAETVSVFASDGLRQPFGIAFYPAGSANPQHVYVANTDGVVRFAYRNGDLKARGTAEPIVTNVSGGGRLRGGGHWTRDIAFSNDNKTLFLSIGSLTNVNQENNPEEERRARIFAYSPDGKNERVYAYGIRNPVGLAIHPQTGQLWTSVNERDGLGDDLVPDYITSVRENGFYGWPYFYIGGNQDPRHPGAHPELKSKTIVPDVLLQSHSASLDLAFYAGRQFPRDYQMSAFAAEHGSWNRARRTGYKIVRVPTRNGRATGEYQDFVTGFVTPDGDVWGRPVGVTEARDGSLLFSDDGGGIVWRVRYTGAAAGANNRAAQTQAATTKTAAR